MSDYTQLAANITVLALDVDGVMTDGTIVYADSGEEIKAFNVKDGLGLTLLQNNGIDVVIITGRSSEVVSRRAQELGIETVIQGREDKRMALTELMTQRQLTPAQVAYMGDDLPDLGALQLAGLGACPADAVQAIRDAADWVGTHQGGQGVIREFAEMLLRARGDWDSILARYHI